MADTREHRPREHIGLPPGSLIRSHGADYLAYALIDKRRL